MDQGILLVRQVNFDHRADVNVVKQHQPPAPVPAGMHIGIIGDGPSDAGEQESGEGEGITALSFIGADGTARCVTSNASSPVMVCFCAPRRMESTMKVRRGGYGLTV